jgi:hypothetical protein
MTLNALICYAGFTQGKISADIWAKNCASLSVLISNLLFVTQTVLLAQFLAHMSALIFTSCKSHFKESSFYGTEALAWLQISS